MSMADEIARIESVVASWTGVESSPHRFGGVEFQTNDAEFGHVHLYGMVDIPFNRKIRQALVEHQLAEPHHLLPDTGWISYTIGKTGDTDGAIALLRLAYLYQRRRRIRNLAEVIEALNFPASVKQAAFSNLDTQDLRALKVDSSESMPAPD